MRALTRRHAYHGLYLRTARPRHRQGNCMAPSVPDRPTTASSPISA